MTGQFIDVPFLTGDATEAIERYRLVRLTGTTRKQLVKTVAGEDPIGVNRAAVASGRPAVAIMLNKQGTIVVVASEAIAINTTVYAAADGKVTQTATGKPLGTLLEAASGDGSQVEMLPVNLDFFNGQVNTVDLFDDFLSYTDAQLWTQVTDAGSVAVADGARGLANIDVGGVTDNNETYLTSTAELFLLADDKPLWFECRLALVDDDASLGNVANVIAGLISGAGANALLDNGGGPPANYSGVVFYKVDGGTAWQAEVSDGATQTQVTLTAPGRPGNAVFQTLAIEVVPTAANTATVRFYVNGTLVGSTTGFDYSNATDMNAVVGVKNGDGTTQQNAQLDYALVRQVR